jgi:sugar lactone lactonase YvrE
VAEGIGWPEGLRWHDGLLWFSDVFGRRMVHSLDEAGTIRDKVEGPNCPSGLGWTPDGDLLVVSMNDCLLLRVRSHRYDACGDAACSRRTNPASIRLGYIVDGGICPPNVGSVWVYPVGGV